MHIRRIVFPSYLQGLAVYLPMKMTDKDCPLQTNQPVQHIAFHLKMLHSNENFLRKVYNLPYNFVLPCFATPCLRIIYPHMLFSLHTTLADVNHYLFQDKTVCHVTFLIFQKYHVHFSQSFLLIYTVHI